MRILFLWIAILSAGAAFGQQFAFEYWHDGKIVLETGDTLKGSIKYDLQNDLIQFSKGGKLESFTARKMTYFEIFDQTVRRYRQFYSIPYQTSGAYKAPVIFELLAEGKMTLLCRESVEYRSYTNAFYSYGSSTRLVLVYQYFLLKESGDIEIFEGKRNDLLNLMDPHSDQVAKYIKANRLDLTDRNEFVQIVTYYNSLFKK
jgi:hypothetical protein